MMSGESTSVAKASSATKDEGRTDADERSRREVINLQYEDQGMQIPYPEVRIALRGLSSGIVVSPPLGVDSPRQVAEEAKPDVPVLSLSPYKPQRVGKTVGLVT
jgi:hypothetical protein